MMARFPAGRAEVVHVALDDETGAAVHPAMATPFSVKATVPAGVDPP